jgi:hypothetical protein
MSYPATCRFHGPAALFEAFRAALLCKHTRRAPTMNMSSPVLHMGERPEEHRIALVTTPQ